jgi:hypothetical protein
MFLCLNSVYLSNFVVNLLSFQFSNLCVSSFKAKICEIKNGFLINSRNDRHAQGRHALSRQPDLHSPDACRDLSSQRKGKKLKTITSRQLVSINVKDVDKTCHPKEKVFSLIIIKSVVLFFFYVKHSWTKNS